MVRAGPLEGWRHLPSLLLLARDRVLDVPFEPTASGERRVLFHRMPHNQHHTSEPLEIEPNAVLQGGIAVLTRGLRVPAGSMAFRVEAIRGEAKQTLFERALIPATEGDRWIDFEIDLGSLAGEAVRFEITTRGTGGLKARAAIGYPVFSLPRLLVRDPVARPLRGAILLSVDTLRADHVGAYGRGRADTPNLDRIAGESMVFETAVATAPSTTASHMSMLTGLYPLVHRVYEPKRSLSREIPTLAQILAQDGWTTAAVTENGMIHRRSGFARGFDYYREFRGGSDRAMTGHVGEVVDAALDWLNEHQGERFFLFLHTYQVHGPYEPPPEFDRYGAAKAAADGSPDRDRLAYAGEVVYADHELGRLFEGLASLGLMNDVALLVSADHGEAFGEHGTGHGLTLYEEAIRVPMLLRAPGRVAPGRRAAPVSLVDIAPTFLDLLGIDPGSPMQGRSLVALAKDGRAAGFEQRAVYAERLDGLELAVHRKQRKWILNEREPGRSAAYDLIRDPAERQKITSEEALAGGLRLVEQHREASSRVRAGFKGAETSPAELGEATIRELRALGYVE